MIGIQTRTDDLRKFVESLSDKTINEEAKAHLTRFGTVLICGHVERAIEVIVLTRLTKKAHPRVLSFVQSDFKRGRNMDCEAIGQLLNRFDAVWYRDFLQFVKDNASLKEALSSCYAVRNSVAHGGNASLGQNRLGQLLDLSTQLIDGVVTITSK